MTFLMTVAVDTAVPCPSLCQCHLYCRALGDVFSQKIEGAKQVDLKRSLLTSVYGAAFIGKWQLWMQVSDPSSRLQDVVLHPLQY